MFQLNSHFPFFCRNILLSRNIGQITPLFLQLPHNHLNRLIQLRVFSIHFIIKVVQHFYIGLHAVKFNILAIEGLAAHPGRRSELPSTGEVPVVWTIGQ